MLMTFDRLCCIVKRWRSRRFEEDGGQDPASIYVVEGAMR